MKIYKSIIFLFVVALLVSTSCTKTITTKESRVMDIIFDELARTDYTLVGNLTAESTVTKSKGQLTPKYAKNIKWGVYNDIISYRGGSKTITITTWTYKNGKVVPQTKTYTSYIHDWAVDFAMYALIEKYPDMDYLTNVKIDRVEVLKAGITTETIKVRATGIQLKTDK